MILHSYLCNALCKFFIKMESNYCFSKTYSEIERYPLIQARKKLTCHVIAFVQRFLSVFDQYRKHAGARNKKKQTPQLALRYCGRTVRSSHRRCSVKNAILKKFVISTGNTALESLFKKVAGLNA